MTRRAGAQSRGTESTPEARPAGGSPPAEGGAVALRIRASLPRRLCALVYEALLLVAMAFVAGFVFLPLVSPGGIAHAALTVPTPLARAMMFGALTAGAATYYAWCWSGGRRTLPQKTWRLRVVTRYGATLDRQQALLRFAAGCIGIALALAGYAALHASGHARNALAFVALNYCWAIVDREGQFLHDRIAGTVVVRDPPPAGFAS